jgi:hypothetical protein
MVDYSHLSNAPVWCLVERDTLQYSRIKHGKELVKPRELYVLSGDKNCINLVAAETLLLDTSGMHPKADV